jgi:hypothetical protein
LREVFDATQLDLLGVARSFGFATPPLVPLVLETAKKVRVCDQRQRSVTLIIVCS